MEEDRFGGNEMNTIVNCCVGHYILEYGQYGVYGLAAARVYLEWELATDRPLCRAISLSSITRADISSLKVMSV